MLAKSDADIKSQSQAEEVRGARPDVISARRQVFFARGGAYVRMGARTKGAKRDEVALHKANETSWSLSWN